MRKPPETGILITYAKRRTREDGEGNAPESFKISCLAMVLSCPPEAGIIITRREKLERKERECTRKLPEAGNIVTRRGE